MAKCISNLKNKAALDTQIGANLGLKCVRMCLAAVIRPDPLGEHERSPSGSGRITAAKHILTHFRPKFAPI